MGSIAPFPHRYSVRLADGRLEAPPRAPIVLGPPPQFGGTDRVWSPEELLLGAAIECLWTTFLAFARRQNLEILDWSGDAVGVLDKGPGGPTFTSIELLVTLTVAAADEEAARRLLASAEKHCIISNALRVPVSVQPTVRTT